MAALIFGASKGGISSAIARLMRAAQVPVHLVGRNEDTLRELEQDIAGITTSQCDFTDESSISSAVKAATGIYGGIDSLAYCGGNIRSEI